VFCIFTNTEIIEIDISHVVVPGGEEQTAKKTGFRGPENFLVDLSVDELRVDLVKVPQK